MSDARVLYVETLYKLAETRLNNVARLSQIRRLIRLALQDVDDPDALESLREAIDIINAGLKSSDDGKNLLEDLVPQQTDQEADS
ncbi:hypothetical protein ATO6_21430 [Oceanicola sp. 22II-s10i]|uniref:hypothetical protein n=1 Tax=Oceanicola sp. 22II-s10i TaxID=1317116 RepID=UPI000B524060|nr:hypothetical protein [Oceanicola sp. 22II-s10i]OWU82874.1 hypothetical protein ATO6_21430 [Oceanicola sp. 22II-s10i]